MAFRELTYREALREALAEELDRDPAVFILGQDIGVEGGMWKVTEGLLEDFGPDRIKDTPISETAMLGAALGAAMAGRRPIVEIMYDDFIAVGMDQLVNQIAKSRYVFGGQVEVPLVVRTVCGYGFGLAAAHSQSLEAWFCHVPGLKVAMPSTPWAAKGLLKSSIRDDNPVVFIESALLYNDTGQVSDDPESAVPLGQATVAREGGDLTIVCWSLMAKRSLQAADLLESEGISAEVIDLQTLSPLDITAVLESVRHTGRLLVVHQACKRGGVGAEILAQVAEADVPLLAPVTRLAGADTPIPFAENLEALAVPSVADIVSEGEGLVREGHSGDSTL